MIIYHHTNERSLMGIARKGLLPLGLNWFTSDSESENTVNFHGLIKQARITVKTTDEMKKFSEWKVKDYDMLCCYTSVEMIDLITDTNKWYYTDRKIEPEEILEFAILENGEWNAYSLSEMQCAEGIE